MNITRQVQYLITHSSDVAHNHRMNNLQSKYHFRLRDVEKTNQHRKREIHVGQIVSLFRDQCHPRASLLH